MYLHAIYMQQALDLVHGLVRGANERWESSLQGGVALKRFCDDEALK